MKTFENFKYDSANNQINILKDEIKLYNNQIESLKSDIVDIEEVIGDVNISDVEYNYSTYKDAIEELRNGVDSKVIMNRYNLNGGNISDLYQAMRVKKHLYSIDDKKHEIRELRKKIQYSEEAIKDFERKRDNSAQLEIPGTEKTDNYL